MTSTPPALTYPAGHDIPRAFLLGACSFVASYAVGLAATFADEPLAGWMTAAAFVVLLPAVRALLLVAAALTSRGLWRGTLGMFWSGLLLEVFLRGTDTDDRGAAAVVVALAALGTVGVLIYLFRPQAKDDANRGTVKVFAMVGAGLLLGLKVLAKAKFFAAHAIARGTGAASRYVSLETFELVLGIGLLLFLFTSLLAIGIALIRHGACDRLLAVCGWLSLASAIATVAIAIGRALDETAPDAAGHDLLGEIPDAVWTAAMVALLVSLRRRALPQAPDRVPLVG